VRLIRGDTSLSAAGRFQLRSVSIGGCAALQARPPHAEGRWTACTSRQGLSFSKFAPYMISMPACVYRRVVRRGDVFDSNPSPLSCRHSPACLCRSGLDSRADRGLNFVGTCFIPSTLVSEDISNVCSRSCHHLFQRQYNLFMRDDNTHWALRILLSTLTNDHWHRWQVVDRSKSENQTHAKVRCAKRDN